MGDPQEDDDRHIRDVDTLVEDVHCADEIQSPVTELTHGDVPVAPASMARKALRLRKTRGVDHAGDSLRVFDRAAKDDGPWSPQLAQVPLDLEQNRLVALGDEEPTIELGDR